MKKITMVLALFLMITTASFAKMKQPVPHFVKILHTKKHVLFIKVHKFFVGGKIEVYSADRHFLESDALPDQFTKMFFEDAPAGKYIIKVTKDKMTFEFEYDNAS